MNSKSVIKHWCLLLRGIDMRRDDICLYLHAADRAKLEEIVANRNSPRKWAWRADIVLATADGLGTNAIMRRTGKSKPCVWRWQQRYIDEGVPGLLRDKTRPSRIQPLSADKKLAIIEKTATEKPANATHWSARKMAKAIGVSHRSVQRVWAAAGLKPHLVRTFKLSNDPNFAEKVVDVVGLYMNPPERALVLCVDEKSQIQALDRTQPGLPMKKGRAQTMTHDYKRNGTTTLFAALDVKTGQVIGECLPRHRAREFIRFLNKIDTAVDKALDLHLILDNYSTHKTKQVQNWLKRNKRFKLHFIPTSSSWLNLVERFFALITEDAIRRGAFGSVAELQATIANYLTNHNATPTPFVWTKPADVILAKVDRARKALVAVKSRNQTLESAH